MDFSRKLGVCPVCGKDAIITRKWVTNRYGKRYDYFMYHHQGQIHYSNQNEVISKSVRKGELERALMEKINSQDFKLGSFRISEIKKLIEKDFPDVGFGSIKANLNKLAEIGILEKQKKGRSLFFINTVSKERLSYLIESLSVTLMDFEGDSKFKQHLFVYNIVNDRSWPLYYIPFRAVGDVDSTMESLNIYAFDSTSEKEIKVMIVEDAPKDKRFLLRMPSPLLPGESRRISIKYDWEEPKQMYVYSSATKMKTFEFYLLSRRPSKLSVYLTSSTTNETRDLSSDVKETSSKEWKYVQTIVMSEVEAFAVVQMKWK